MTFGLFYRAVLLTYYAWPRILSLMNSASLFGTLTNGTDSILAAYAEEGFVRLDNSLGHSWNVEESDWRTRRGILLAAGWWAA